VCTVLPRCRRRIGTNSILAGARVRTNNRALLGMQTTVSEAVNDRIGIEPIA